MSLQKNKLMSVFHVCLSCYWQWICQSSLQIHSAIASWIHSYYDNVMMKIILNNRKNVRKTAINLLTWQHRILMSVKRKVAHEGTAILILQKIVSHKIPKSWNYRHFVSWGNDKQYFACVLLESMVSCLRLYQRTKQTDLPPWFGAFFCLGTLDWDCWWTLVQWL